MTTYRKRTRQGKPPEDTITTTCRHCGGKGSDITVNPEWIAWARGQLGLSFRALAERLELSAPYLHDIENGKRAAPERVVAYLKRALGKAQ